MLSWASLDHLIQTIDYRILLPTMARMPLALGEHLSGLRGMFQAILDYEWRSMALRQCFVRKNTYEAMSIIMPDAGRRKWISATLRRFIHNSREEWQACLFGRKVMSTIAQRSQVDSLQDLLKFREQGRGLVLVSCHFDSFCMGMVLLGMNGLRVNVVNTSMIEDQRIHPAVRAFFNRKYRAMEYHMGGKMVYHQVDLPFFYRALEKGETVVLMGDIPGSKSNVFIPFFGRSFRMPLGAWHMAKKTGSVLGAFVCLHQSPGRYRVICLPPKEIDPNSPKNTMEPIYGFLEAWIRKAPERWVAADLLPGYGVLK
jgi:lauroyl/myristoyl acyltransferase